VGDKAKTAVVLNNIGGVYQTRRKLKQALDFYEQALVLDREIGHQAGVARELMNMGALYVEQQSFVQAEALLVEAVTLLQTLDSPQKTQAEAWLRRAKAKLN
jgi:tetratricopeptide (TPR) repeat protein